MIEHFIVDLSFVRYTLFVLCCFKDSIEQSFDCPTVSERLRVTAFRQPDDTEVHVINIGRVIMTYTFTVGQRRWSTAVSHLPTWRPPKQANKTRPDLVYYNHHTLTQVYTQIDMGRRNSVPENRDLQSLNFVTRTLCIFGGRWRTQRCEVEDSVCLGFGGGGLQFLMHASIDLSRYILYVEEFLIGHKLSFFKPDINTH